MNAAMDEKAPPEQENANVPVVSTPHGVELLIGMCLVAFVSLWLSPVLASLLLACMPVAAYLISVLSASEDEGVNIEGESFDELEVALLQARDMIAKAETTKKRAVEGSTVDRDRLYRLRGELTALGGSEDRVHFLSPVSDADSTLSKRAELRRAAVIACRACEERRVAAENAAAAAEDLRQKARDLEVEIEATLQQREAEQASREHLDEEKTKLRAQASRVHAKITAQDEQLRHARGEVQSYAGYTQADSRRLQNELSAGLQVKMRQVRNEEQERKQKQGEKRFVESVGERLYENLAERTQQVTELHARLKQEATEKQAVAQAIESAKAEIMKCQTRNKGMDASAPKDCDDRDTLEAKAKSKSKATKAKKKKDGDISGNKDIEDLELERASVVAAKELAEKKSRDMAKAAETMVAHAVKHAEAVAKECKVVEAKLAQLAKEKERIESDQAKIADDLKQQSEKVSELEGQIKDAERAKIRLRLDIKKLKDGKQELRARTESEIKERSSSTKADKETLDVVADVKTAVPEGNTSSQAHTRNEEDGNDALSLGQTGTQEANCAPQDNVSALDKRNLYRDDGIDSLSADCKPSEESADDAKTFGVGDAV